MRSSNLFLRIVLASLLLLGPVNAPSSGIGKLTAIVYEPQSISAIARDVSGTGATDIINVTEAGILLDMGLLVTTAVTGTPVVTFEITIDGGTTRSVSVWNGSSNWVDSFKAVAARAEGAGKGSAAQDAALIVIGTPYKTSLQVAINVTTAAGVGVITASVLRGVRQ